MANSNIVTQPKTDWAIKTPYNAKHFPKYYEVNNQPSLTVPDQTMSLKMLLERYSRGIPINGEKTPIYHGDEEDLPDLKKMDISEIAQLKEDLAERIKEQRQELMNQEFEKNKAEAEKRQKEQFKKWKEDEDKANLPTNRPPADKKERNKEQ